MCFFANLPHSLKPAHDFPGFRKISAGVAARWMGFDRKNLTVDAKAADAVGGAELQRGQQRLGVGGAEPGQLRQGVGPCHPGDGGRRRGDELDRLLTKHAAKAEANHGFPEFHEGFVSRKSMALKSSV